MSKQYTCTSVHFTKFMLPSVYSVLSLIVNTMQYLYLRIAAYIETTCATPCSNATLACFLHIFNFYYCGDTEAKVVPASKAKC